MEYILEVKQIVDYPRGECKIKCISFYISNLHTLFYTPNYFPN